MQKKFDTLINSYLENNVGIAENFLSASLSNQLAENLTSLNIQKQLVAAGVGNNAEVLHNKLFRSDIIHWLDRKHNNQYENNFLTLADEFVSYLNATCYTGITGYEFHYALYEKGSFYKKHLDQFRNSDSRKYSMIMYLNKGWQEADGGELCIHHKDRVQKISPENRTAVFFKSNELEHEVLVTNKSRMSIAGWLKVN